MGDCAALRPPLVSSLGAKKQLLGAKKQLTGLPLWPGNGSAIFSWFRPLRFDLFRPHLHRPTQTRHPIRHKGDVASY